MAEATDTRQVSGAAPLRVGIVGLGKRWHKRYRPALAALHDRVQISAVCDQVQERAIREARRLDCPAVTGPTALARRRDTDVLLLIDPQWFGLWPIQAACREGKPSFSCDALEVDEDHADTVYQRITSSGVPVMIALPDRLTPAALTLQELLAKREAEARLVVYSFSAARLGPWPCSLALLDWCTSLLEGAPSHVLAAGMPDQSVSTLLLRYPDGKALQINRYRAAGRAEVFRELQVFTDRGSVRVRLPRRICWRDGQATFLPRLQQRPPVEQVLLGQFHAAVVEGRSVQPGLTHVYRLLGWLRAALHSGRDHCWVEIS
jgi:predicted dehydrogenase